jgi:hypothetical protein
MIAVPGKPLEGTSICEHLGFMMKRGGALLQQSEDAISSLSLLAVPQALKQHAGQTAAISRR